MNDQERTEASLCEELERRIRIIESTDESSFGEFTRLDWIVLLLIGVVLPVVMALAAR
jgi:hypothetical protein